MTDRKATVSTILLVFCVALICAQMFDLIDLTAIGQKATDTFVDTTDMVDVTRPLTFIVKNQYGGAAIGSATLKVYKGLQVQESLTTDGTTGVIATGLGYSSGDTLKVLIIKSNAKCWYDVLVPKIRIADAEAVTNIQMPLFFFDLDTSVSLQVRDNQGNSYATTETLNFTTLGVAQVSLQISGFVSADDKSYISSYDPIVPMNWNPVLYGALSGTGFDSMSMSGWQGSFAKSTTSYGWGIVADSGVTKNKIGTSYEVAGAHLGTFTKTVTLTKGGYTGSDVDLVVNLQAVSYTHLTLPTILLV